jgi:hypothetical protein
MDLKKMGFDNINWTKLTQNQIQKSDIAVFNHGVVSYVQAEVCHFNYLHTQPFSFSFMQLAEILTKFPLFPQVTAEE